MSIMLCTLPCSSTLLTAAKQRFLVDKIIARVNNKSLLLSSAQESRIIKSGRPYTFDELINEELLCQKFTEVGFLQTTAELDSSLSSFKIINNLSALTDDELDKELRKGINLSLPAYKQQLSRILMAQKIQNYEVNYKVVITAQEVEDYWKEHPEHSKDEYHLKLTTLDARTKKMASEQLKEKASWQDLGWFEKDELGEQYKDIALSLNDGEVSAPIEKKGMQQVLMLVQKKTSHLKPLQERYQAIEKILHEEKHARIAEQFAQELRHNATIIFY